MQRNAYEQFSRLSAIPLGHLSPSAWVLPKTAGAMSSVNNARVDLTINGTAYGGITTTGSLTVSVQASSSQRFPLDDSSPLRTASSSISINFSTATGKLIASGAGSASILFNINNALLTASINGLGSASIIVTPNVPTLGALTSGIGTSSISITASNSVRYPTIDTSPLRTAISSITFSGSLNPYATGTMQGSTADNTVLTGESIAAAVWSAVASEYNTAGSTGNKLNTASTGGVDINSIVDAILEDLRFKRVLTKGSFLALK